MTCTCGKPGRTRDVADPVTQRLVARGVMCNPCFDSAIVAAARHRRRHDKLAALSPLVRALMGMASILASLAALGCALEGRAWPGVVCVGLAAWFAARVWRDDVRRAR